MIYMHILVLICALIFNVADFCVNGVKNFKRWEFYVWMMVILFNGYIVLNHKAGAM